MGRIRFKKKSQMDILLSEFNRLASDTKSDLRKIQDAISNGKVPTEASLTNYRTSMSALQDKFNTIRAVAKDKLPAADFPPEGSTAEEYVTAVNNHNTEALAEYKEKTLKTLNTFNKFRSDDERFQYELQKYQKEASENIKILKQSEMPDDQFTEIEDYVKVLAPVETFFEAINCEDIDSEEGLRLLDKICEYFSLSIATGITYKMFYIPDDIWS